MIAINLRLEPHVGVPIVNRAEAEAGRRFRAAKRDGNQDPFERLLADAYGGLFSTGPTAKAPKPELVVLVSHEISQRGWNDIEGAKCARFRESAPCLPRPPERSPPMPS
jgi:hypothetical protein